MTETMEKQHWAVEVRVDGEQVITIESDFSLAGINPLGPYEESVRRAAEHLTAFLGRRPPAIDIIDLREAGSDGGGLMGYWAKGHHDRHAFADAVNEHTGADWLYDTRYVVVTRLSGPQPVRHEWWRAVPLSGEPGHSVYHSAEPHSRGAFPVTVTTIIEDRERKAAQRNIDEFHKGSRSCFAEGLIWALHQLDDIDEEADKNFSPAIAKGTNSRVGIQGSNASKVCCLVKWRLPLDIWHRLLYRRSIELCGRENATS